MIHVFRAKDGKWNIAPASVRNWPQFQQYGVYPCKEQARAIAEQIHPGETIKVESGFFG